VSLPHPTCPRCGADVMVSVGIYGTALVEKNEDDEWEIMERDTGYEPDWDTMTADCNDCDWSVEFRSSESRIPGAVYVDEPA